MSNFLYNWFYAIPSPSSPSSSSVSEETQPTEMTVAVDPTIVIVPPTNSFVIDVEMMDQAVWPSQGSMHFTYTPLNDADYHDEQPLLYLF